MAQRKPNYERDPGTHSVDTSVATPADRSTRISARAVVLALVWLAGTIIVALVLLQLFVVQRIPPLDESRLAAAEERWAKKGPESYHMHLEIGGAQPGVVQIEVEDGAVTSMTRDGRSPAQRTWEVWSVPGQFETLARELELAEDPVHEMQAGANTKLELRCEFDATYGYPRQYQRVVYGGGPQVNWRVTAFEAR